MMILKLVWLESIGTGGEVQGYTTKFFGCEDSEFYIGDALLDRKFDIETAICPAIINGEEQTNLHIISGRRGDVMTKLGLDMISLTQRALLCRTNLSW